MFTYAAGDDCYWFVYKTCVWQQWCFTFYASLNVDFQRPCPDSVLPLTREGFVPAVSSCLLLSLITSVLSCVTLLTFASNLFIGTFFTVRPADRWAGQTTQLSTSSNKSQQQSLWGALWGKDDTIRWLRSRWAKAGASNSRHTLGRGPNKINIYWRH